MLSGDQIGHEVLELPDVANVLIQRWGDRVLTADGKVDRSAVAKIVFDQQNPPRARTELEFLESVTHPKIEDQLRSRLAQLKQAGRCRIAVLDAAVLFKAGWHTMCDRILFVDAPRELRQQRATHRGLAAEQFAAREASQTPVEEKRKKSDIVIDNSGAPEKTCRQVQEVWHSLLQIA